MSHDLLSATTRYCAVLGQPIRHSASPAMHNPAMAALGLNWRYLAFEVNPRRLPQALEGCRAMRFLGVNLTVPHKLLALPLMDELDETAAQWGAVNTVAFEARDAAGRWRPLREFEGTAPDEIRTRGYNTDADAILRALEEDL
ncbi:MAG: shikimate dehydrogenase, partial [Verrucomicrobia bacterium]|nr:shikimate dehydrogenase [Verrucomicrobiota bacterium]